MKRLDSQGALTLPLAAALLAASLFGLGTLGLMRHWRHLTELQLRLDRCVGDTALSLRGTLRRIEAGNTRLRALRTAQAAALLVEAAGSLTPLMELEVAHQQLELMRWQAKQAQWAALRGCGGAWDWPVPLPSMNWERPPADELGPQPLRWGAASKRLRLQLAHSPRAAAAEIEAKEGFNGETSNGTWKASWAVPRAAGIGLLGTSVN